MSDSDRKDKLTAEEIKRRAEAEAEALANATTLPPRRPTGIDELAKTLPNAKRPGGEQLAGADTLPLKKRPRGKSSGKAATEPAEGQDAAAHADTVPGVTTREVTGARVPTRRATFPPTHWEKADSVISSASPEDALGKGGGDAGIVATDHVDERLSEQRAREILNARFKAAGIILQADYSFREADLLVTLDGYDELQRVGYAYISHADVDVVTDFDEAAEMAFEQLATEGKVFILIVHDTDVPTPDALEKRIDTFFIALRAATEETQRF
jgi:hypothetical protein